MSKESPTNKAPAFQFYPKDFLTDTNVILMSPAERGMYITLLCLDWLNDGILRENMGKLSGDETLFLTHGKNIEPTFEPHPTKVGFVTNKRLQKERGSQQQWREKSRLAGIKSGKARKELAKSTTKALKVGSILVEPNVNSSSTSTSTSTSTNIILDNPLTPLKKIKTKKEKISAQVPSLSEFGLDGLEESLNLWIEYKNEIKDPCTQRSLNMTIKKYAQNPQELKRDIELSVMQGWKGIWPPKTTNGYAKPAAKSHQDQIIETMKTIFEEAKQNEN